MKNKFYFLLLPFAFCLGVGVWSAAAQTWSPVPASPAEVAAGTNQWDYLTPASIGPVPSGSAATLNTNQVVQYDYYPVNGNTNALGTVYNSFAQGIANDGTNVYIFNTGSISRFIYTNRTTPSGLALVSGVQATNGLSNFGKDYHFGDGDYFGGYVFAPLEATVGGNFPLGKTNLGVAMYDSGVGGNLYKYFSVSNWQQEISAVTVGIISNNPTVFTAAFLDINTASSNNTIFEYSTSSLTNLTFVKALTLNTNLAKIQGLKFIRGKLYALCDQETGFGTRTASGRVFEIDVTNETARLFTEINVPGQTEWEGLDYYTGTTNVNDLGFAWAGEGSTAIWIFNWFGIPTITSNQVFTGKFVGDISETWGQISDDQLPGDTVKTNSNALFNMVFAKAGGFGAYYSGYFQSGYGYWSFWNNQNGKLSFSGNLSAPFTDGNNTSPAVGGTGAFFTLDGRNSMVVVGGTNEEVILSGAIIANTNVVIMGGLQLHPIANAPAFTAIQKTNDVFIWESNNVPPTIYWQYYDVNQTLQTKTSL